MTNVDDTKTPPFDDQVPSRPVRPFRNRLDVVVTASGPVELRPRQLLVRLDVVRTAIERREGADDLGPETIEAIDALVAGKDSDDAREVVVRYLESVAPENLAGRGLRIAPDDVGVGGRRPIVRVVAEERFDAVGAGDEAAANGRLPRGAIAPNVVFRASAFTADPMRFAGAYGADPMRFASMIGADPMRFANSSTARPAPRPTGVLASKPSARTRADVFVIDTGIPIREAAAMVATRRLSADLVDAPDANDDRYLDIAAGHNTFISTIIERAGARVHSLGGLANDGDGDEVEIGRQLATVHARVSPGGDVDPENAIVNLSFSGYSPDDRSLTIVSDWIDDLVELGVVVVAAAGNDGTCRPKFPAAMPTVISVGSLGACGPSPFSNHGPWVDVSAPGEDLVSEFFHGFDGAFTGSPDGSIADVDRFERWAMWSGTSFATAAVCGAIAETMANRTVDASDAVRLVIGRPGLYRVPDYGVVVNRIF